MGHCFNEDGKLTSHRTVIDSEVAEVKRPTRAATEETRIEMLENDLVVVAVIDARPTLICDEHTAAAQRSTLRNGA